MVKLVRGKKPSLALTENERGVTPALVLVAAAGAPAPGAPALATTARIPDRNPAGSPDQLTLSARSQGRS